jgi:ABC-type lipoprotein export system ATPase subunit
MTPNSPLVLDRVGVQFTSRDGQIISIVEDLSVEIDRGITCFVGRSGSGKTSVLRTLASLTLPTKGDVIWWGKSTRRLSEDELRRIRRERIGYADQASTMIEDLTTVENVLVPALPESRSRRKRLSGTAMHILDQLQMRSAASAWPSTLSGGERQRAALARAMLLTPEILIVDEPTASLDRATADSVIRTIGDYAANGRTVIVASHDPHLIEVANVRIQIERT